MHFSCYCFNLTWCQQVSSLPNERFPLNASEPKGRKLSDSSSIGAALHSGVVNKVKTALMNAGMEPFSQEALLTVMTLTYRKSAEVLSTLKKCSLVKNFQWTLF